MPRTSAARFIEHLQRRLRLAPAAASRNQLVLKRELIRRERASPWACRAGALQREPRRRGCRCAALVLVQAGHRDQVEVAADLSNSGLAVVDGADQRQAERRSATPDTLASTAVAGCRRWPLRVVRLEGAGVMAAACAGEDAASATPYRPSRISPTTAICC